MKYLRSLFLAIRDVRTIAMFLAYALLPRLFLGFELEVPSIAFALGALGIVLGHQALLRWERVQRMRTATMGHQKAQEALTARVEELDKSVKSLTNAVGSRDGLEVSATLAQDIVALDLEHMHKAAKERELSLDQAKKLVLYLGIYQPEQDEGRPFAGLTDEQLRAALVAHAAEAKKA